MDTGKTGYVESTLGLYRHEVRLRPYDPAWNVAYQREETRLHRVLRSFDAQVEHTGSTSVPGLPAKPIIDIAVGVLPSCAIGDAVAAIAAAGYIDRGDKADQGGWLLVREDAPEHRFVHLHLVARSDPQWDRYLAFRDLLRTDPAIRREYAHLKSGLASRHSESRRDYTAGKHDFVRAILTRHGFPFAEGG